MQSQLKGIRAASPVRPRWRLRSVAFIGIALASYAGASAIASFGDELLEIPKVVGPRKVIDLPLPTLEEQIAVLDEAPREFSFEDRMRVGDTVGALLDRLSVSDFAAQQFIRTDPIARRLLQLRPGGSITARTDEHGQLIELRFPSSSAQDAKAV
ncbi:MAG TPA: hypothetical protein VFS42_00720, partial [Burkholderiaceae bacterium]|nr:hypothetical protein [Burkholderiaceae bacterium]